MASQGNTVTNGKGGVILTITIVDKEGSQKMANLTIAIEVKTRRVRVKVLIQTVLETTVTIEVVATIIREIIVAMAVIDVDKNVYSHLLPISSVPPQGGTIIHGSPGVSSFISPLLNYCGFSNDCGSSNWLRC